MIITKRSTSAAILDVLERAGSTSDAPARRRRRIHHPRRRALLAAAALAVAPAVGLEDAHADEFRPAWASWYGPGLYGNALGCGGVLEPGTVGVAHKTKPCGTRLRFCARRCATARVIDRGPFVAGREFDLTARLKALVGLRIGARGAGKVFVRTIG